MEKNIFDLEKMRMMLWHRLSQYINDNLFIHEWRQQELLELIEQLYELEKFWAYPGLVVINKLNEYQQRQDIYSFRLLTNNILHALESRKFRKQEFIPFTTNLNNLDRPQVNQSSPHFLKQAQEAKLKLYFEILIVHPNPEEYELLYRNSLTQFKTQSLSFTYDFIMVDNYHDAIMAILANPTIQACVFLSGFKTSVQNKLNSNILKGYQYFFDPSGDKEKLIEFVLSEQIKNLRPELDQYFITEIPVEEDYYTHFDRVIMGDNIFADLHYFIISGIEERYSTPFFDALRNFASKPVSAFHALPISQGQSINQSFWIADIMDFYTDNIFSAETSSTLGGLDSLMDPKGSISQAQNKAAQAFNSLQTYFVTNGTTTANKIVMQANLQPDDIVLVSSDCHKSIPYSIFLSGAKAIFLETYPLNQYDLYGCVTLERIKEVLIDLKAQGMLEKVKQITLTNSTFDGVIYNVRRFMLDILSIKPDIIFHWDEAWFAFAAFHPLYNNRTAMTTAHYLTGLVNDEKYLKFYSNWRKSVDLEDVDFIKNNPLYPDPKDLKVRVYATQSIHKTLTAFRQASMLHIHDVHIDNDNFLDAYRTHTSTSPNYQLIASLDFARRQMVLEGYELIKHSIELAVYLRDRIKQCPILASYYEVLEEKQLIPEQYTSQDSTSSYFSYIQEFENFQGSIFSLNPTHITLDIHKTGVDGPNFRQLIMTQYDIQINKTSRNTILLIINIGVNRDSINYLLESLTQIATKLSDEKVLVTTEKNHIINLPQTRLYHKKFVSVTSITSRSYQAVDVRKAYYAGLITENIDYTLLANDLMSDVINDRKLYSASFVTPYPPGFPIIIPGQLIDYDLLLYIQKIQLKEIHGYHPEKGLKIFNQQFLQH